MHLVGAEAVFLQPQREVEHVFVGRAGVGGDEIRDQVLFLACLLGVFLEELFEFVVSADARFHHLGEWRGFGVFRRNF